MDLLAIAALEAFDGAPQDEKPVEGVPALPDSEGNGKTEAPAEVSADDIDPSLSLEGPPQSNTAPLLPPPPPPRLSASLANILSAASTTAAGLANSEQAIPTPSASSPYRPPVALPIASPTPSTSSDVTMVYHGPPIRLSEDSGLIRCICPFDDDDGFTIQCETCFAWLHGLCVDISPETVPDIYTCPLCVSGGRIARQVEIRAARLQQLRKEAEDVLRRQRVKSNATTASFTSSGLGSDPAVPTSELDEEYELLAKARGLAYQQSFDSNFSPTTTYIPQPLHPSTKPTQSPYYQREQLPVQQHTLGPSPFLHPPQGYPVARPPQQQQAKRAGSVASNNSNSSGPNAKRSKSGSPGGSNLPAGAAGSNPPAVPSTARTKKRSTHAPQSSLPSIPQNSVLPPHAAGATVGQTLPSTGPDLSAPPPPKKRRSISTQAKEKESTDVSASILAPTSGSYATNAAIPSASQVTATSVPAIKDASISISSQPVRKTRLAAASVTASSETSTSTAGPAAMKAPLPVAAPAAVSTNGAVGPTSGSKDAFMSDDEDSGTEDRFEPWQFEYTPINYLRYADRHTEQAARELVEQFVEEERENLNALDGDDRTSTSRSSRASPFGNHSRHSSARPSLLGSNAQISAIAQASRMGSPNPSSGSSTPAYSSSGVACALAPPCLPIILPEPPISPSDFPSKLSVKPLATSSMSLAPPACTPFSGPTCVPSLMNPYPRPTIHGVFTSNAFSTGTLITFMHGEVVRGEEYRDDPINQWHDLGAMKCHTRGLAQPWDLVLDQRRFADESRFIRNGCHPNVFVKPVIIRKSRKNDTVGKKGRSAAKRKAEQQRAVQEGGEFELVFGLYALQDIAKREELVLPFDWADDHVVHSLHTLLFSPSLVFPTIPSNVESETEDDGIPSTSSFTHLTTSQKSQIAQCTQHLYRLSRLASQTCLTLLGTSICACEKRRDCSIAWLWKLACFSESSSARSRGTIQLQDFDLNGLRIACASALATDDKDWVATPGANGRMSNKKSSKKRRADLGALIGLARGWEKPAPEPVSAIPPRMASEEEAELQERIEEAAMQVDERAVGTSTPAIEHTSMDFGEAVQADLGDLNSAPTSAELDKADKPFQFAPPESVEQAALPSPAPIGQSESNTAPASSTIAAEEAPAPALSTVSSRPDTAQSIASEKSKAVAQPVTTTQAEDSDSDITEPLPSDHSDAEEAIKVPVRRKSPVKEMAKVLKAEKRKPSAESESRSSHSSPSKQDDMALDEEEIVRPPKKKKPRKQEVEKTPKNKSSSKTSKVEEEHHSTSSKKTLKPKMKTGRSGDGTSIKDKSVFGSGLPSFRTKKDIFDQAKQLAMEKAKESTSRPIEVEQRKNMASQSVVKPSATPSSTPARLPAPLPANNSQLDSLFDMPVEPPTVRSQPSNVDAITPAAAEGEMQVDPAQPAQPAQPKEVTGADDRRAMQVDNATTQPESTDQTNAEDAADKPVAGAVEALQVVQEVPAVPVAPPVRRVSFQAYKKRVFTAPSTTTTQRAITEEPSTLTSAATEQSATLSVQTDAEKEPVLGKAIVQTPIAEKTQSEAEASIVKQDTIVKSESTDRPSVEASPAAMKAPPPGSNTPGATAKPRLSFAAYRQRATTLPKQTPSPASVSLALAPTPPAPMPPVLEEVKVSEKEVASGDASKASPTPIEEKETVTASTVENATQQKAGKIEEEQEEGELVVDPNLEPGEVEMESSTGQGESALGMRMGDLHQPKAENTAQTSKQSYTPPSRLRSLTPPKPVLARRIEEGNNIADSSSRQARPATSDGGRTRQPSFSDHMPNATSSNANWESLKERPHSPVMDRAGPESSRYSASGASPPSHPRGFGRGSPRNQFNQPLPGSKPPTGPRSSTAPWPPRGRANSASGPPARVADTVYGGGFGTAGSGGSSYRPGSSGRSDGPPPPRTSQPPSGPRALQGSGGFAGRGRGGARSEIPSRDRGWQGRGGGRGGRERGYRGGGGHF